MKGKLVGVTGGTGFIGSHLVEQLVAGGNEVVAFDNISTGQNVEFVESLGAKVVKCDVGDYGSVVRGFDHFDAVFHLAAMNRAQRSIDDPVEANRINVVGTMNVLEACRANGVPQCIFTSSSSVYGGSTEPLSETRLPDPTHPYAAGKLIAEYYVIGYNKVYGMKNSVVRFFSVFGPRQRADLEYAAVIPKFIGQALKGEPLTVFGDGEQKRNFTSVKDAVAGTLLVAERKEAIGEVFNIGSDKETSINQIVDGLSELFGRKLDVKRLPPPHKEPVRNVPDISKARKLLGFKPSYPFKDGLRDIFEWYARRN
jgi:nucleoside-diphosphate-sugar epimerase